MLMMGVLVALAGSLVILMVYRRRLARWCQPPDATIDALIRPPVPRFAGQDDALRVATAQRRERADAIKRGARLIETKDDRGYRLRKVM